MLRFILGWIFVSQLPSQIAQNQAMIVRLGERMDQPGNFVEQMRNYIVRATDNLSRALAQRQAELRETMREWQKSQRRTNDGN